MTHSSGASRRERAAPCPALTCPVLLKSGSGWTYVAWTIAHFTPFPDRRMSDDLNRLSAREMARRFAKGDLSPVDVLEAALTQLQSVNPVLNAICLLDEPQGQRLAAESALRWRR